MRRIGFMKRRVSFAGKYRCGRRRGGHIRRYDREQLSLFFGKSNKREDSEGYTRICPTCGKRISAGASRCPYCREELSPIGHAVTEGIMGLLKLLVIFAVVMMILISIAKGGFSWLV